MTELDKYYIEKIKDIYPEFDPWDKNQAILIAIYDALNRINESIKNLKR